MPDLLQSISSQDSLNVRDIRLRLGLSQRELGLRLGVTGRTIWRWEHSETIPHHVYLDKLRAIADAMPIKETRDEVAQ